MPVTMKTRMLMMTMVRFMDMITKRMVNGDVYGDDDENDDTYQDWRESPP